MPKTSKNQLLRSVAAPRKRQGARPIGDEGADSELPRKFLTGPQVCARYSISDMSLWRWLQSPTLGFPAPTLIVHQRRYWGRRGFASVGIAEDCGERAHRNARRHRVGGGMTNGRLKWRGRAQPLQRHDGPGGTWAVWNVKAFKPNPKILQVIRAPDMKAAP